MPASRRARAPRTPLSTAFQAGGGVVRARLRNLFTTCRRGTALLAAAVLITTLSSGLVACQEAPGPDAPGHVSPSPVITPTPAGTPSPTPVPEHTEPEPEPEPLSPDDPAYRLLEPHVLAYIDDLAAAEEAAHLQDGFEEDRRYTYVDREILSITPVWSGAHTPDGRDALIYAIDFRLLADHPDRVTIAGGRDLDDEGWLHGVTWCYPNFILAVEADGTLSYYGSHIFTEGSIDSPSFLFGLAAWENGCPDWAGGAALRHSSTTVSDFERKFPDLSFSNDRTIDALFPVTDFEDRWSGAVEVCRLDFRIRAEDPSAARAAGLNTDEEGRFVPYGTPSYLVLVHSDTQAFNLAFHSADPPGSDAWLNTLAATVSPWLVRS